jgi:hypothetical protein
MWGHSLQRWSIWAVLCLCGLTLVSIGGREWIHYDGYWHIFIARQNQWNAFWNEVRLNAHPPLYYLLLKAATLFGRNELAYRSVSILATLGSVWFLARIVRNTTQTDWLAPLAALAFGLALNTISVGLEVRAYMLSALLVLASFDAYLGLVQQNFGEPSRMTRLAFAGCLSLALLTHYATSFFVAACLAGAIAPALFDAKYRSRLMDGLRRQPWLNIATLGAPILLFAALYILHVRSWAHSLNHLPEFFYSPDKEGVAAFLFRSAISFLELLLPPLRYPGPASTLVVFGPDLDSFAAGLALAFVGLALLALAFRVYVAPATRSISAGLPVTFLMCMVTLLAAAALMSRYPFGGPLRHQFIVFPFVYIVLFIGIDQTCLGLRRTWARRAVVLLVAISTVASVAAWMRNFQITRGTPGEAEVRRLHELFGWPETLYVDQFNLIPLFSRYHAWDWALQGTMIEGESLDLWRLARGGRRVDLCRDKGRWLLDLAEPALYRSLSACMKATGAARVVMFRPQQDGLDFARPSAAAGAPTTRLALQAGLGVQRLILDGEDVYGEFAAAGSRVQCPAGIAEQEPLIGKFADGWLSTRAEGCIRAPGQSAAIELRLFVPDDYPIDLQGTFKVDGFARAMNLSRGLNIVRLNSTRWPPEGPLRFTIEFERGLVPSAFSGSPDHRELTAIFKGLAFAH